MPSTTASLPLWRQTVQTLKGLSGERWIWAVLILFALPEIWLGGLGSTDPAQIEADTPPQVLIILSGMTSLLTGLAFYPLTIAGLRKTGRGENVQPSVRNFLFWAWTTFLAQAACLLPIILPIVAIPFYLRGEAQTSAEFFFSQPILIVVVLALILFSTYVYVRLSLTTPLVLKGDSKPIRTSWAMTKGQFNRIVGHLCMVALVTWGPLLIVVFLVSLLLFFVGPDLQRPLLGILAGLSSLQNTVLLFATCLFNVQLYKDRSQA